MALDDYSVIDSKPVDNALTFLLEHLPPQMHLVIASREDPHLPLSPTTRKRPIALPRAEFDGWHCATGQCSVSGEDRC